MFVTLTHRNSGEYAPDEAARRLSHAWKLIAKRIKRLYGYKRLPYLAVFEAHKSGYPHLHILLRCRWIDQATLSAWCAELLDSPRVDVRRVRNKQQAAVYVSKYVGKAPGAFGHCKRYWCTPDWRVIPKRERPLPCIQWDWVVRTQTSARTLLAGFARGGAIISYVSDTLARAWWPNSPPEAEFF